MKKIILLFSLLFIANLSFSQTKLGNLANPANTNAVLDVESTNKGVLLPRMSSAQRDNIASPAEGLTIYNTTDHQYQVYNGNAWVTLGLSDSQVKSIVSDTSSAIKTLINGKLSYTPKTNGIYIDVTGGDADNGGVVIRSQANDGGGGSQWHQGLQVLRAGMATNRRNMIAVGESYSARNVAYLGFKNQSGSGNNNNYLSLGMHSVDDVVAFDGNRNIYLDGPVFIGIPTNSLGLPTSNRNLTVNGNLTVTGTCTGCSTTDLNPTYSYNSNVSSTSTNVSTLNVNNTYNTNTSYPNSLHEFYQRFQISGQIRQSGNITPYGIFQRAHYTHYPPNSPYVYEPYTRGIAWGYYIGSTNRDLITYDGGSNLFFGSGASSNSIHVDRDNGRFGIGADANASYKLNVGGSTQIGGNLNVSGNVQINGKINTSTAGTVTLAGQTVTVNNSNVSANSVIILTPQEATTEVISVSSKTAGTGFTIQSSNANSTITVGYIIIN